MVVSLTFSPPLSFSCTRTRDSWVTNENEPKRMSWTREKLPFVRLYLDLAIVSVRLGVICRWLRLISRPGLRRSSRSLPRWTSLLNDSPNRSYLTFFARMLPSCYLYGHSLNALGGTRSFLLRSSLIFFFLYLLSIIEDRQRSNWDLLGSSCKIDKSRYINLNIKSPRSLFLYVPLIMVIFWP